MVVEVILKLKTRTSTSQQLGIGLGTWDMSCKHGPARTVRPGSQVGLSPLLILSISSVLSEMPRFPSVVGSSCGPVAAAGCMATWLFGRGPSKNSVRMLSSEGFRIAVGGGRGGES